MRFHRRAPLILCLFVSLWPAGVRADPDDVRRPGADSPAYLAAPPAAPPRPRRWGLFGAGVALFAVGYAADVGLTYGMHHAPATTSLIPIAGPLLQLSQTYTVVSAPKSTGSPQLDAQAMTTVNTVNHTVQIVVTVGLVVDAALQLAGITMAIAGPASRRARDRAEPRLAIAPGGLTAHF